MITPLFLLKMVPIASASLLFSGGMTLGLVGAYLKNAIILFKLIMNCLSLTDDSPSLIEDGLLVIFGIPER